MGGHTFRAVTVALLLPIAGVLAAVAPASAQTPLSEALPNLVARLLPEVVNITVIRYKDLPAVQGRGVMVQQAQTDKKRSFGSGFIVTPSGYVVTNKHVTHNGVSFTVALSDGRRLYADLVAESEAYDIGVLKIRTDKPLDAVMVGDSDGLRQGDPIIAIGNPLGQSSTVTIGIISALNRDLNFTDFDNYIQLDAAINEGNSGGPLFNAKGEVIGVNSAILTAAGSSGSIGIGYAIPINDVIFLVKHMKEAQEGHPLRPGYLGAIIQSVIPDLADAYGLPSLGGSIVVNVLPGSPAATAGLQVGDIIMSFDGVSKDDSRALLRAIVQTEPGTKVKLNVWRNEQGVDVAVVMADQPPVRTYRAFMGDQGVSPPDLPPETKINFGLALAPMRSDLRAQYRIDPQIEGVVVTGVAVGSEAADRGVDAGAVVMRVRDQIVATPDDLAKAVATERDHKSPLVPMLVADDSGTHWVPFRLN